MYLCDYLLKPKVYTMKTQNIILTIVFIFTSLFAMAQAINQVTVKPEHGLYNGYGSLKEQIINWLNEEILFYQTEQAVVIAMPNPIISDTKIHTSLSVPQLALLFRLLKEEQLITNTNQSELLKVVSGCFTTMHKESFSYGHLHGKYYKIEQHTKRTVYDMLIRLLHLSRKIG